MIRLSSLRTFNVLIFNILFQFNKFEILQFVKKGDTFLSGFYPAEIIFNLSVMI